MPTPRFFTTMVATALVKCHGRLYRTMLEVEAFRSGVNGLVCAAPASEPGARDRWTLMHEMSGRAVLRGHYTDDPDEARRLARRLGNLYRWDLPADKVIGQVMWEDINALMDKKKWRPLDSWTRLSPTSTNRKSRTAKKPSKA